MESGSNDPMAIFLTIGIAGLLLNPGQSVLALIPAFILEMTLGVLGGYAIGRAAVWLINHLRLEYDGLYPVLTITTALVAYGGVSVIGGSGFLAVYIAGLVMSSRIFLHRLAILQFHDGLAWLMQIAMFLTLGLFVFPNQLVNVAWLSLSLAVFLILVARPLAVFISLARAKMTQREKLFVSWGGLRGAVPIILATFPLTMGVKHAEFLFHIVFFVALTSVAIQGTTLGYVAKRLKVISPETPQAPELPVQENLFDVTLEKGSPIVGKQVIDLGLPNTALIVLLTRRGQSYVPRGSTVFQVGDVILVATRKEDWDELRSLLAGSDIVPL
jgi:cell volume regulation protein A